MLIDSISQLRAFIPQLIEAGRGEVSLLDKVAQYIEQAQLWLAREIVTEEILDKVADSQAADCARKVVAAHALWLAIPSLDITLTSSGFAVASTDQFAPASANRVRSLRDSVLLSRDSWIVDLISRLRASVIWRQSHFFSRFDTIVSIAEASAPSGKLSYDFFRDNYDLIRSMEDKTAVNYIGPVIFRLRALAHIRATAPDIDIRQAFPDFRPEDEEVLIPLLGMVRPYIMAHVASCADREGKVAPSALEQAQLSILMAVDYISRQPQVFPEWHNSSVSRLFDRQPFPNSKKSGGYFF